MHIASTTGRRTLTIAVAATAVLVLLGGVAALAEHQFTDVPATHPFHEEISTVADAGITGGYSDGTFGPSRPVSRQAAAAFVERSAGRIAFSALPGAVLGTSTGQPLALLGTVTIEAGAAGDGNGYVVLDGSYTAFTDGPSACPCDLSLLLFEQGVEDPLNGSFTDLGGTATETGFVSTSDSLQWVVPVAADRVATFELYAFLDDADVASVETFGQLSALYVPFGPDSGATTVGVTPQGDGPDRSDVLERRGSSLER